MAKNYILSNNENNDRIITAKYKNIYMYAKKTGTDDKNMPNESKGCLRADFSALLSPFSQGPSSMSLRSSFNKYKVYSGYHGAYLSVLEHTCIIMHVCVWIYNMYIYIYIYI